MWDRGGTVLPSTPAWGGNAGSSVLAALLTSADGFVGPCTLN